MVQSWTNFDADWYLQQNPDVAAAGVDPLWHARTYGLTAGRAVNPFVHQSGQNNAGGAGPESVFYQNSVAGFQDDFGANYLRNNQDVFDAVKAGTYESALDHYQKHGQSEGRAWGGDEALGSFGAGGGSWQHYAQPSGTVQGFQQEQMANNPAYVPPSGGGGGAGGGGGVIPTPQQPSTGFDMNAFNQMFQQQMGQMQNQWKSQFDQYQQSMNDKLGGLGGLGGNQWGQMLYNGASQQNNGFQAGQPTNMSPVYNPNPNGQQPRNGFGGPLGNNNPWSPTF